MKKALIFSLAAAMLLGTCCSAEGGGGEAAGTYTFEESAMGGQFTVLWTLELGEDGTYVLTEGNPFAGDIIYEGSYTYEDGVVTTGAFENELPQADFFESDKTCQWVLEGETCTPVAYEADGAVAGELPEGAGEESDALSVTYASVSESQVCDIYLPEEEGTYPVIVLVHGGGFMFGDQKMAIIQPVIEAGLAHGYAVVSVDYRKSGEAAFPAALADVKAAVRFVRANAAEYGFDADRIVIWGESAGAYLSLMTALTSEVETLDGDVEDNGDVSSAVAALVDFYGPVEFYTMDEEYAALGIEDTTFSTEDSFESQFLGQAIGEDQETTYQTYWETYVQELPEDFSLKAWIQVGNADTSVPYTQSENFAQRLAGVIGEENVSFGIIDGAEHEDAAFYTEENLEEIFTFLS